MRFLAACGEAASPGWQGGQQKRGLRSVMDEDCVAIDPRRFREVCGQYATGVAVVTARCGEGRPTGVTVNSFTSVSLDPPLIQFSLDRKASVFPIFLDVTHF